MNFVVYKSAAWKVEINLPGTGDTVIKKAVPSGGDLCIALRQVEACDFPKRGKLGCAIFGSGGLRSRIPLLHHKKKTKKLLFSIHFLDHIFRLQVVQDFVQATEDEETTKEWLHRIMETSSRESSDYDINLLGVEQRNAQIKLS